MIYVQIKAGLGNQLFQYAFGKAKSLEQKRPLALDISWYSNMSPKDTPRTFLLDKYNIDAHIASPEELKPFYTPIKKLYRKICRRLSYKKDNLFHPTELASTADFFEGHWANEKYFKKYANTIRKEITPKTLSSAAAVMIAEIDSNAQGGMIPILVHVRRGDCVSNPYAASYQGTMDTSYYDEAREILSSKFDKEKLVFFIFSDDIGWAKENLLKDAKRVFVSRPEIADYEELYIMSKCQHFIIGNSSFSWWGAWLSPSPSKVVIAPRQWLKDTSFDTSDVCPSDWIRI